MRIKTFTAATVADAFEQVKAQLGNDAVIISNENINGLVHLTAAIEEHQEFNFFDDETVEVVDTKKNFDESSIRNSLHYHGVLDFVENRILATMRQISVDMGVFDEGKLLELAFAKMYQYSEVLNSENPVKMFMGTPGSGKSTAIAKAATRAKIQGKRCLIISTDNVRAGANNQLEAFARILEQDFLFCKSERNLFNIVEKAKAQFDFIFIDTPGINPFIADEVKRVSDMKDVVKSDTILTLDAGKNTYEAIEIAEIFTELGARCLLPTKLDLTRRIGAIISVANCCELAFVGASVSSSIANGLANVDNKSLAKLIGDGYGK